jgi:hypothetical protein
MAALLSFTVDLVTSTFYQKRKQAGTAEPMKKSEGISKERCFPRTFSVVKELTVLNYREAVSFILPRYALSRWLRSEKQIKTLDSFR